MVARFELDIRGDAQAARALDQLAEAMGDLSPLAEIYGTYLESATIGRFDDETAPDGSAWSKSIRAREEGGKTLSDSGQLRSSITHNAFSDRVEVGSNKIYAGVHQDGATIRPKSADKLAFALPGGLGFVQVDEVTIPARPFLGLSQDDEVELAALTEDYAVAAFGAGGEGARA